MTPPANEPSSGKTAILLHGLASHPLALNGIRRRLRRLGFKVYAPAYPTMSANVDQILDLIQSRVGPIPTHDSLYFVTHSMGGLMARAFIERFKPPNLARVVMLAPPNQGTEYVDRFSHWPFFRAIYGPTTIELGTSAQSLPRRLPPPTYELGIIAGRVAIVPLSYWILPKPNDGIVSVSSTRLEGMADHLVVPYSHRIMISIPAVMDQVVHFLLDGHFARNGQEVNGSQAG